MTQENTNEPLCKTAVSKAVFNYEVERLESGFLARKENERIGINNADGLESRMKNLFSESINLKEHLYYKKNTKVNITIVVEVTG